MDDNMYLKNSQIVLDKGSGVNEDIGCILDRAAWVLDGSTGVTSNHVFKNYDSDAQWFTRRWNKYLQENIERDQDLKTILKEGVNIIKDEFFSMEGTEEIPKIGFPSSTLALVRWYDDYLEYFILADNIISIEDKDGITSYKDNLIDDIDQTTFKEMHKFILENDGDLDSAREHVSGLLQENRNLKNKEGGYYVLEFDDFAIDHGVYGKVYGEDFNILIATDGFTAISEKYNHCSVDEMLALSKKHSVDKLNNQLRQIERDDNRGRKYPRIKVHDDSTAILLCLESEKIALEA